MIKINAKWLRNRGIELEHVIKDADNEQIWMWSIHDDMEPLAIYNIFGDTLGYFWAQPHLDEDMPAHITTAYELKNVILHLLSGN